MRAGDDIERVSKLCTEQWICHQSITRPAASALIPPVPVSALRLQRVQQSSGSGLGDSQCNSVYCTCNSVCEAMRSWCMKTVRSWLLGLTSHSLSKWYYYIQWILSKPLRVHLRWQGSGLDTLEQYITYETWRERVNWRIGVLIALNVALPCWLVDVTSWTEREWMLDLHPSFRDVGSNCYQLRYPTCWPLPNYLFFN